MSLCATSRQYPLRAMPFIGSAGPKFFLKESMEDVAAIKDIGNYFDRAEYIKWKSFRDTDDARYIGLVMPRVLGRLPYGPDTVPVRSFNYVEEVKGPDHDKYLWTNARLPLRPTWCVALSIMAGVYRSWPAGRWCGSGPAYPSVRSRYRQSGKNPERSDDP
jgi:type VI secretion system ImpC/EvpB family protein